MANRNVSFPVRAVDVVGRHAAEAQVNVDESCDGDPPVHFTKPSYNFTFSNCRSSAADVPVGRVEEAGHGRGRFKAVPHGNNYCQMVEVKADGRVTFGPATCRQVPHCCPRGEVYELQVALVDIITGRPSDELADVRVINQCSY